MKKGFLYIVLLFIIVSCGEKKSEFFQLILKSDYGYLRGISIGDDINHVKGLEEAEFLRDSMPDYLHYDYEISMGNSYTVTYDFSEDKKLYEIELAAFLDKIEDAGFLFNDFNNHFTRRYGKGKMADDGFTIWKIENAKQNVEIAMINDSQSYGYLSIIIRDLDY